MKSSKLVNIKKGFALLHERKLLKGSSPMIDRLMNLMVSLHDGFCYNYTSFKKLLKRKYVSNLPCSEIFSERPEYKRIWSKISV